MVKYERHPAPEKLFRQMIVETVNLLALGGPDKERDAELPEAGVSLIAKAWGLPQADLDDSLNLIRREKQLAASRSNEAVLPDGELGEPFDGGMIAELLWGLFETAVRLDDAGERGTIHRLALQMADALDFDEWIEESIPTGNQTIARRQPMMTVAELKAKLSQFSDDEPVWVYEPNDENEPYQAIESIERGPAGDIAIYRE